MSPRFPLALVAAFVVLPATVAQGAVPVTIDQPVLRGWSPTVRVGDVLAADTGTWTGAPTAFAYAWLRCSVQNSLPTCQETGVTGDDADLHIVTAADLGTSIAARVTASNADGAGAPVASGGSEFVGAGGPTTVSAPSIAQSSGMVTKVLTVSTGTWSSAPATFGYQWLRCNGLAAACRAIPGATSSSYVPTAPDAGLAVKALVQADPGTSSPGAAFSQLVPVNAYVPTGADAPPPAKPAPLVAARGRLPLGGAARPAARRKPTLTGRATVGRTLRVKRGTWIAASTYRYRWLRAGKAIKGATRSSYRLRRADRGKRVACRVTARGAGGTAVVTTASRRVG